MPSISDESCPRVQGQQQQNSVLAQQPGTTRAAPTTVDHPQLAKLLDMLDGDQQSNLVRIANMLQSSPTPSALPPANIMPNNFEALLGNLTQQPHFPNYFGNSHSEIPLTNYANTCGLSPCFCPHMLTIQPLTDQHSNKDGFHEYFRASCIPEYCKMAMDWCARG